MSHDEAAPAPDDSLGRRRRRRPRAAQPPSPDPRGWRALGIVAGCTAVLAIAGLLLPAPGPADDGAGTVEPVDSSVAVCPEPGSSFGSRTTSTITVVPGLPGQDREGEAEVAYLGTEGLAADSEPRGTLAAPGDVVQVVAETDRLPPLQVRADGGLAPGLVAAQSTQDSFNDGRGLASQACLAPGTSWWFVGGGSTAGRESELVLVNPEETPADVEVSISGPDGPVTTPRLRGIVVEPRSRLIVRLSREAPRLPAAAWRVTVRQGRVMAAVSDRETEGFIPRGADWIPASAEPSTRVLIPGVIGGEGGRQLLVHAPGDLNASVRVRLITAAGSFVPAATPEIEVPGGAVIAVDLDSALQGDDATVDLQSDVPIVAGVRQRHPAVDASAGSLEETSFTTGAIPIDGMAAVTGLPAARGTGVTVWITAPDEVTTIERAPMPEDMEGSMGEESPGASPSGSASGAAPAAVADDSATTSVDVIVRVLGVSEDGVALPPSEDIAVTIPRGRLVPVDVPRPPGATWFTVVASVEGGEVVIAHRVLRRNKDGSLITGYPWRPLRTSVVVPRAVPAPGLAVSGS